MTIENVTWTYDNFNVAYDIQEVNLYDKYQSQNHKGYEIMPLACLMSITTALFYCPFRGSSNTLLHLEGGGGVPWSV